MNLSDNGRVTPVKRIFGSNADIGIKGETQIEKWAYFRENVHRNFRPTHWKNVAGGIIFGIVIPYGLYKFIMWGMEEGTHNMSVSPNIFYPQSSFQEIAQKREQFRYFTLNRFKVREEAEE